MKQAIISNNGISYVDYVPSEDFGLTAEQEIASCKALLAESDYKVTKNAECLALGLPLPYNAEELHKERQALRDRINELEKEL